MSLNTPSVPPPFMPLDRHRLPGHTSVREAMRILQCEGKALRLTRSGLRTVRLH